MCACLCLGVSILEGRGFEGLGFGVLPGRSVVSDHQAHVIRNISGNLLGFTLTYGYRLGETILAPDINVFLPYVKGDNKEQKLSLALGMRFGLSFNEHAFPFVRIGYVFNSVALPSGTCLEQVNFSSIEYGLGIDVKIIPCMSIGIQGDASVAKRKAFLGQHPEYSFSRFQLRLVYLF